MRYVIVAVLAVALGALGARAWYSKSDSEPVDPISVIVMQMKTHAIIEHEARSEGHICPGFRCSHRHSGMFGARAASGSNCAGTYGNGFPPSIARRVAAAPAACSREPALLNQ